MSFLLLNFDQKYNFSYKNNMVSAWRNFKNIFPRPLFITIFSPEMLKFHPYSILTGDKMVGFVIFCVLNGITLFKQGFILFCFPLHFFEWTMETENFQIFWHFDCVQKNPKGSFYELRKGLLHAMCSRIKIKAFLVPKCIKGEKTLKLCRSLLNHFGLRSFLKKHSRFVSLWLWRLKATRLSIRQTWFLKDYDN